MKDPEAKRAALAMVAEGYCEPHEAAEVAGVSLQLMHAWLKRAGMDWRRTRKRALAKRFARHVANGARLTQRAAKRSDRDAQRALADDLARETRLRATEPRSIDRKRAARRFIDRAVHEFDTREAAREAAGLAGPRVQGGGGLGSGDAVADPPAHPLPEVRSQQDR